MLHKKAVSAKIPMSNQKKIDQEFRKFTCKEGVVVIHHPEDEDPWTSHLWKKQSTQAKDARSHFFLMDEPDPDSRNVNSLGESDWHVQREQ